MMVSLNVMTVVVSLNVVVVMMMMVCVMACVGKWRSHEGYHTRNDEGALGCYKAHQATCMGSDLTWE